ncbi:MAG TPA: ArsR family transcriptional regulator [Pyrinomonadaceae bacterium]|nr:ArsR family transcriptional regulator [Pyrinomonadaceae bacterium]
MGATTLDQRFFDSTRGRIVCLLREGSKTVNELAEELGLTDNAVRAQLLSLERDGLVKQKGIQRGRRRPHLSYVLTDEAEELFPKAYDALLNQLIAVLKGRLTPGELGEVLREVGRNIADRQKRGRQAADLRGRAQRALTVLEALGGSPRIEREAEGLIIRSGSCPLAAAVSEHPEVCGLAEALVAEVVGATVQERCERDGRPKCCFELREAEEVL